MTLTPETDVTTTAVAAPASDQLGVTGPGRWIRHYDPENTTFWESKGRAIARRNLSWSIFTEFLGFVVWQLWSIVVVTLPAAGFSFSTSQTFWLISVPSLVGATLRFPYTFMVPRFGGRNWTAVSALLLLIPTIGLALCVSNPDTPFSVMILVAALAGLGGGNFASSMANITFFFPAREKGWALGLNAAGGNLGAAVAQFVVPIAITLGAAATVNLPLAGLIWIPLILLAAFGAWRFMDNLSSAKSDLAGSLAALREPHLWILAVLYIGTFGSFIGFAGVFPKLIADTFTGFTGLQVGSATVSLAFLGALVGSLARPYGGRLADQFGGARIAMCSFAAMAVGALAVVLTITRANFPIFLACFLFLFVASGIGNGATYRMIPMIFASRAAKAGASETISGQRKASAALGMISAIGAYGGFFIPQLLNLSNQVSGSYFGAFYGFVAAYLVLLAITFFVYVRGGSGVVGARI